MTGFRARAVLPFLAGVLLLPGSLWAAIGAPVNGAVDQGPYSQVGGQNGYGAYDPNAYRGNHGTFNFYPTMTSNNPAYWAAQESGGSGEKDPFLDSMLNIFTGDEGTVATRFWDFFEKGFMAPFFEGLGIQLRDQLRYVGGVRWGDLSKNVKTDRTAAARMLGMNRYFPGIPAYCQPYYQIYGLQPNPNSLGGIFNFQNRR